MNSICEICGFVKVNPHEGLGYAGNICTGHASTKPERISREELREIVAEEIAKVRKDIEDLFQPRPELETTAGMQRLCPICQRNYTSGDEVCDH